VIREQVRKEHDDRVTISRKKINYQLDRIRKKQYSVCCNYPWRIPGQFKKEAEEKQKWQMV
jgi:hypothetical protein